MRGLTEVFEGLCDEYAGWCQANGLFLGSADEHLFDEDLTQEQRDWLKRFCSRWDDACKAEREMFYGH